MRRRRGKRRWDFQDGPVQRMVEKGENPGFCTGGLENAPLKRQNSVDNSFTFLKESKQRTFIQNRTYVRFLLEFLRFLLCKEGTQVRTFLMMSLHISFKCWSL